MEPLPLTIQGIWYNETKNPISVVVNDQPESIILQVEGNAISRPTSILLSDRLIMDFTLSNDSTQSNPLLLWEDPTADQVVIWEQKMRATSWSPVEVIHTSRMHGCYLFTVTEQDGLLIVGTVELIDPDTVV